MRRSTALVALILLPLAVLSFRGSGEDAVTGAGSSNPELPFELTPASGAALDAAQTGDIYGRVHLVAGPDTVALPRVVVWLMGTPHFRLSDSDGEFGFSVPPGSYTVRSSIAGYRCNPVRVTVTADAIVNASVYCDWRPSDRLVSVDTVMISVDVRTGIVMAFPNPLYIAPGDCVVWFSEDGPWAVHFAPISPLSHRRVFGSRGQYSGGCARTDIFPGSYSYFVAVEVEGRIYTEDPEIIDENEEEEGDTMPGGG